jgi:hypothetical protein
VPGAILIVIALVVFPVLVCIGSVIAAAGLGILLQRDGAARHEGSELVELYY